jgi:hypothetical protein
LSAHIVSLTRQNLAREDRQRGNPRVYDGNGQPIDLDAQIARAEAIREEKRQTESRKAYAADVARRAAREDFLHMRKSKKQKAAVPPESVVSDRTPVREKFWSDIGVAITSATQHGVSRVAIIADMLTAANNIAAICEAEGEDMSALAGLL